MGRVVRGIAARACLSRGPWLQGVSCVHTRPLAAKRAQIEDLCAQSMVGIVQAHCRRIRHGHYLCTFAPPGQTADVGSSLTIQCKHTSRACRLVVSERPRPARSPGRAARPERKHSGARECVRAVVVRKDVKPRSREVSSRNHIMRASLVECARSDAGQGARPKHASGTQVPPAHHGASHGRLPHQGPLTVSCHEHQGLGSRPGASAVTHGTSGRRMCTTARVGLPLRIPAAASLSQALCRYCLRRESQGLRPGGVWW